MSPSNSRGAASGSPGGDAPRKQWWQRIPTRLLGGHVRTSTALLVIVFVGLLLLYGQRSDHYTKLDEQAAAASASRAATPSTTQDAPAYTEPTRSSSMSSSPRPSESTTASGSATATAPGDPGSTTTTTRPGVQLPTIPGIVLPGQTPTTTPVR